MTTFTFVYYVNRYHTVVIAPLEASGYERVKNLKVSRQKQTWTSLSLRLTCQKCRLLNVDDDQWDDCTAIEYCDNLHNGFIRFYSLMVKCKLKFIIRKFVLHWGRGTNKIYEDN